MLTVKLISHVLNVKDVGLVKMLPPTLNVLFLIMIPTQMVLLTQKMLSVKINTKNSYYVTETWMDLSVLANYSNVLSLLKMNGELIKDNLIFTVTHVHLLTQNVQELGTVLILFTKLNISMKFITPMVILKSMLVIISMLNTQISSQKTVMKTKMELSVLVKSMLVSLWLKTSGEKNTVQLTMNHFSVQKLNVVNVKDP